MTAPVMGGDTRKSVALLFEQNVPLKEILKRAEGDLTAAMRGPVSAPALVRSALVQIASTPALVKVSETREGKLSLVSAVFQAAALGLMVGGPAGEAAIVPYKGKAKLLPMVRGLVTLAIRAGTVLAVSPVAVYEGDAFKVYRGTRNEIIHEPDLDVDREDDSLIRYVYAVFQMQGGAMHFDVMNRAEVERIRAESKDGDNPDGPWRKWWGEKAKVTVVKRASKMVPLSPEFRAAVELDSRYETGRVNEPSDLLDSAEEVQAAVVEKTKASSADLKARLAKPADCHKQCRVENGVVLHVPDCRHYADEDQQQ